MSGHTYTDEDGQPLFQVRRRPEGNGKTFRQFRWDGQGWAPGLDGTKPVLYRLVAVRAAVERGGRVYVTEGEKDADRLAAEGLTATTNPGGAGKWRDEFSAMLRGASAVVVVRDRDRAGRRHALDVDRSLKEAGVPVRHRRPRQGNDVSDHLDAGLSLHDLVRRPPRPLREKTKAAEAPSRGEVLPAALQLAIDRTAARQVGPAQWEGCCPAHADRHPSLSIARGEERPVVLHCHAGCDREAIAAALDLDLRELSVEPADPYERKVAHEQERIEVRNEAQRRIASEQVGRYELPAEGRTFKQDLAEPRPDHKYAVAGLHLAGGNTLLTSAFKAGKTTLALNLARSLADGEPFLGEYEVALDGRVAFLNYELGADTFREWAVDVGVRRPDRIAAPWHLRGATFPFWLPDLEAEAAEWLRREEVQFLIVDPAARAWRGLVDNENDNAQLAAFTDALDTLKRAAGVANLLLTTHMGRGRPEEGEERARGATRLEDWMDVGWYLTAEGGPGSPRALRAQGRDVDLEAIDLTYSADERRLTATGQTRAARRETDAEQHIVDALAVAGDGLTTGDLTQAIPGNQQRRSATVQQAALAGLIERRYPDGTVHDEKRPAPRGKPLRCYLTKKGKQRHHRKVDR